MAKTIQIRNVPDELHKTLKVRAAKSGMTLSDYLLSEMERMTEEERTAEEKQNAGKPTMKEWLDKVSRDEPVELDEPPAATIRRFRDADDPRDLG
ncbi:hypothetical protein BH20ACT10_BH20ACT10_10790 [soil metagenome]|jgi:plasmid stability protein